MIGKSDQERKAQFLRMIDSKQGHYQSSGALWQNENLNKKASKYVRENTAVKATSYYMLLL